MLDDYSGLFCLLQSLIHIELGIKIKLRAVAIRGSTEGHVARLQEGCKISQIN